MLQEPNNFTACEGHTLVACAASATASRQMTVASIAIVMFDDLS